MIIDLIMVFSLVLSSGIPRGEQNTMFCTTLGSRVMWPFLLTSRATCYSEASMENGWVQTHSLNITAIESGHCIPVSSPWPLKIQVLFSIENKSSKKNSLILRYPASIGATVPKQLLAQQWASSSLHQLL